MIKVKANSLELAYEEAASKLECSITQLTIEVIQHPKSGFLGFFKKSAVIVATCKPVVAPTTKPTLEKVEERSVKKESPTKKEMPAKKEAVAKEVMKKSLKQEPKITSTHTEVNDAIIPNSFVTTQDEDDGYDEEDYSHYQNEADDEFYDNAKSMDEIAAEVKSKINELFNRICFKLDEISVEVYDENTLYITFSGDDAALLIGKEGYRYKALSYIIYNWINAEYQVQLRMEIAEFLKNQEESVSRYLQSVCESIKKDGRAQTKVLDGVLVQIALKELRSIYPEKYVAIRSTRDGSKYIIINDYNEY